MNELREREKEEEGLEDVRKRLHYICQAGEFGLSTKVLIQSDNRGLQQTFVNSKL